MHWSEINPNPDNPAVINFRNQKVLATYKKSVDAYATVIQNECAGKEVIDFGAANHTADTHSISENDTHSLVVKHSARVSAVDIVEFSQTCNSKCSHYVGDFFEIENLPFEKADVIFAGHVIEHLESPYKLFEFATNALKEKGQLVVITPNPLWFPGLFFRSLGKNISVNADHVALFGASELIEIGERNGFRCTAWYYSGKSDMPTQFRPGRRIPSIFINLLYMITRFKNLAFSHNQIVANFSRINLDE
jgi:SAM-dependent methyltransferase